MEEFKTIPKMQTFNFNNLMLSIKLSVKGEYYRARTSLNKIPNAKTIRPEAISSISFENAVQKLLPKIEKSLIGTNKKLGKVYTENNKILFSVEEIIYEKPVDETNSAINLITDMFSVIQKSIPGFNQNIDTTKLKDLLTPKEIENSKTVTEVIIEWLKHLLTRTKKPANDEEYLSPKTLEGYNSVLRDFVFPYLKKNEKIDNISTFCESNVDEILNLTKCKTTKRILLVALRLMLEYAKNQNYITINPIANKKQGRKNKQNKDYDFIEEEQRAVWINCMLKEIHSKRFQDSDAGLAFLCTLLHGNRPEETCGTKWTDFDFEENDYHIQNAYKKLPVYDEETMKRIAWENKDGPLKTPESNRHLSLDLLFKQLLLEHKIKQMYEYRKKRKKWSKNEYVFHNSKGTPFTPDTLSKNFSKFVKRNNLPKIVLYGLRHSFATHCRNLGVKPEVLARLMGHTEYQTTQKYYIHISPKQKREALQKVQQQDLRQYLDNENKDLKHLQDKVLVYSNEVSNLQEVQNEDMTYYLQINDNTLNILKEFIEKINKTKLEKVAI